MKLFIPILLAGMVITSTAFGFSGEKTFMPNNDLNLQKLGGGITEAQFNAVLDRVEAKYGSMVSDFGAKLTINRRWSDDTVNASAEQPTPTSWRLNMYGGLARRPEVTEDGFAMVVCHELGHHLAGFPYVQDWAANEGQSDMYATSACASEIFAESLELDAAASNELPDSLRQKCDDMHPAGDREICYRGIVAGKSLADLLGALGNSDPVGYDTPDTSVVSRTNHKHPAAQCRLDSYVAGALCGASKWDYALIPGKSLPSRNSKEAQAEAFDHSCENGDGARPKCWFAAIDENAPPAEECPYGNPMVCEMMCQLDPSQPWCD